MGIPDKYFLYSKAEHLLKDMEVIDEFPCIREFGHIRYKNIQPTSLKLHYNKGIEICYVKKGRYNWCVEGKEYSLYPNEGFLTCPWEFHGSSKGFVDIGEIYWIVITPQKMTPNGDFHLAKWTSFSKDQEKQIGVILANNKTPVFTKASFLEDLLSELNYELQTKQLGYNIKVQNLLELVILETTRCIKNRNLEEQKDNQLILEFENFLNSNLEQKCNIDQMAAHFNMGSTAFNDKVKKLTGFSPSSYLINLRIEKSKDLLTKTKDNLTEIALACGFYSSQHFSSTFKKRTGMTPSAFRKTYNEM